MIIKCVRLSVLMLIINFSGTEQRLSGTLYPDLGRLPFKVGTCGPGAGVRSSRLGLPILNLIIAINQWKKFLTVKGKEVYNERTYWSCKKHS